MLHPLNQKTREEVFRGACGIQRRTGHQGMTLIELLALVAISGVLIALLIPVVGNLREDARTAQGLSQLRQLGLAVNLYAADHHGRFPSSASLDTPAEPRWPWLVAPYTGVPQLQKEAGKDYRKMGLLHICPNAKLPVTDPRETTYSANDLLFLPASNTLADPPTESLISAVRRPSQVIMIADGYQNISQNGGASATFSGNSSGFEGNLMQAVPVREADGYISYRQRGAANAVFVDGHAETLPKGSITYLNMVPSP